MDFVSDSLFNGRRIRALTIVDNFSSECLAIHVDHSVKAEKVVEVMHALKRFMGRVPERVSGWVDPFTGHRCDDERGQT